MKGPGGRSNHRAGPGHTIQTGNRVTQDQTSYSEPAEHSFTTPYNTRNGHENFSSFNTTRIFPGYEDPGDTRPQVVPPHLGCMLRHISRPGEGNDNFVLLALSQGAMVFTRGDHLGTIFRECYLTEPNAPLESPLCCDGILPSRDISLRRDTKPLGRDPSNYHHTGPRTDSPETKPYCSQTGRLAIQTCTHDAYTRRITRSNRI